MLLEELVVSVTGDTTGLDSAFSSAIGSLQRFGNVGALAGRAITAMSRQTVASSNVASMAIGGLTAVTGGLLVKTVLTAARTDAMGVAFYVAGKNAGYTKDQLDKTIKSMEKLGITTQDSYGITAGFIQNNLKLADALKVARAAQDLAVMSGQNSSDAAATLTQAISAQEPMLLRQFGIVANLNDIYLEYGKAHHLAKIAVDKNGKQHIEWRRQLTQTEKKQAFLNTIMKGAASVTGTYTTAMMHVGKQLTSFPRYFEEASNAIGGFFLPAFSLLLDAAKEFLTHITTDNLNIFVEDLKSWQPVIATVAGALLGLMVPALVGVVAQLAAGALLLAPWAAAFGVLGLAIAPLVKQWLPQLQKWFKDLPTTMRNWRSEIEHFVQPISDFIDKLSKSKGVQQLTTDIKKFVDDGLKGIGDWWDKNKDKINEFVTNMAPTLSSVLKGLGQTGPGIAFLADALLALGLSLEKLVQGKFAESFQAMIQSPLAVLVGFGIPLGVLVGTLGKLVGFISTLGEMATGAAGVAGGTTGVAGLTGMLGLLAKAATIGVAAIGVLAAAVTGLLIGALVDCIPEVQSVQKELGIWIDDMASSKSVFDKFKLYVMGVVNPIAALATSIYGIAHAWDAAKAAWDRYMRDLKANFSTLPKPGGGGGGGGGAGGSTPGGKQMPTPRHGGIFDGPATGYPAMMHNLEAVVPLDPAFRKDAFSVLNGIFATLGGRSTQAAYATADQGGGQIIHQYDVKLYMGGVKMANDMDINRTATDLADKFVSQLRARGERNG